MKKMQKNMTNMNPPDLYANLLKILKIYKICNLKTGLPPGVGPFSDCCNMTYMHDLQNMQNMLLLSSTTRALGAQLGFYSDLIEASTHTRQRDKSLQKTHILQIVLHTAAYYLTMNPALSAGAEWKAGWA
jgi:hypothetical protein